MSRPAMRLQDCFDARPEVCAALKKTPEELAGMTLGEFYELAYYNGYDVRYVAEGGEFIGLTVKMDDEGRPIMHVT